MTASLHFTPVYSSVLGKMAGYFTVDDHKQHNLQCVDDDTETNITPMLDAILANLLRIYEVSKYIYVYTHLSCSKVTVYSLLIQ